MPISQTRWGGVCLCAEATRVPAETPNLHDPAILLRRTLSITLHFRWSLVNHFRADHLSKAGQPVQVQDSFALFDFSRQRRSKRRRPFTEFLNSYVF
jgi:hypothetical protein